MVHFHNYTKLEGHQSQNWISISMVWQFDDFQESLDFDGHGSYFVDRS